MADATATIEKLTEAGAWLHWQPSWPSTDASHGRNFLNKWHAFHYPGGSHSGPDSGCPHPLSLRCAIDPKRGPKVLCPALMLPRKTGRKQCNTAQQTIKEIKKRRPADPVSIVCMVVSLFRSVRSELRNALSLLTACLGKCRTTSRFLSTRHPPKSLRHSTLSRLEAGTSRCISFAVECAPIKTGT